MFVDYELQGNLFSQFKTTVMIISNTVYLILRFVKGSLAVVI
jgi:hypothetical protein